MIKDIKPKQAFELLEQENTAILVDVRSTMEYEFVGHPINALHLPLKEPPDWNTQPEFVNNLKEALAQRLDADNSLTNIPLLMLCRSGVRSKLAGELLVNEGFTAVYNILEGFEGDKDDNGHRNTLSGWRFHKLPWQQS